MQLKENCNESAARITYLCGGNCAGRRGPHLALTREASLRCPLRHPASAVERVASTKLAVLKPASESPTSPDLHA